MLSRVYEPKDAMLVFFDQENRTEFALEVEQWCIKLVFLSDIFETLNKTNASLQDQNENLLTATDNEKIAALRDQIDICLRNIKENNFEMFEKAFKA